MRRLIALAPFLFPALALAHPGHHHIDWHDGFLHPLTGLDHLMALLAAGVWLAQSETRGKWLLIAAFIAVLALAIPLGMQFAHLTFEAGIVATLVVLGALMTMDVRGPLGMRAVVVLTTAAIHGFVHGTELPVGEAVTPFIAGLIVSSMMVIAVALAAGGYVRRVLSDLPARLAGVAVVVTGIVLSF